MAGLNAELAGKTYESRGFEVTADGIRRYAEATNEDNPAFNSERPVAPPAFAFVVATPGLRDVMLDPDLGADMAMLVHAEQDHRYFLPIRAGDRLRVETKLEEVDLAPTGHTFTVAASLANQDGRLAAEARSKMFIRKTGTGAKAPKQESGEAPEYLVEVAQQVDEDQTQRYAEASGDDNPIHLDRQAARQSGFPGVIVHGMCTMAFASKVLLDNLAGGDPGRLRRLSVQFSRPVFPGQTITTRAWSVAEAGKGSKLFGFETVNSRGSAVIKEGLAEIFGPQ
ncbi:MAG: MaoC/PaaZ C-terminal domain-containing protein [Actinomycetota bacterium]